MVLSWQRPTRGQESKKKKAFLNKINKILQASQVKFNIFDMINVTLALLTEHKKINCQRRPTLGVRAAAEEEKN